MSSARHFAGGSTAPGDATTAPWPRRRSASPERRTFISRLGMRSATSALVPYWAISIEFARGHAADAMDRLEKGLSLGGRPAPTLGVPHVLPRLGGGGAGPGRGLPHQRTGGFAGGRAARQRPVPCPRALETGHPGLVPRGRPRPRCTTSARSSCTGVPGGARLGRLLGRRRRPAGPGRAHGSGLGVPGPGEGRAQGRRAPRGYGGGRPGGQARGPSAWPKSG